jgi:threonine dehydrogenase-like Zn-dependent dehydrogenase
MKALVFERKLAKYAAATVAGRFAPGSGAKYGPLSLKEFDPPDLPGPDWVRFKPRLSGICGSDLATIDGHSSRYFEPIVSFPFVLGHEVVGDLPDGSRAVLIPVLHCSVRGIAPVCAACAAGNINLCERIAFGHLEPGLQSGFCRDTGGGWSIAMVAHHDQLFAIPDDLSDENAVMIEPAACAVHAARKVHCDTAVVIGAGTLGLLTVAALRAYGNVRTIIATAKYREQRSHALALGADTVVEPAELSRAIRSHTKSMIIGTQLTGGADCVVDCVGSTASLTQALDVVGPGRDVLVVGMPAHVHLDLTTLWHRETAIRGCYAYTIDDFASALALVQQVNLGSLVTTTYPLDRYEDAITHAANAGPRAAVKIAFDLRTEKQRKDY